MKSGSKLASESKLASGSKLASESDGERPGPEPVDGDTSAGWEPAERERPDGVRAGLAEAFCLKVRRPFFITPMRWARRATVLSWVTSTMVRPCSRHMT